ncbi:MAG: hypothetical protein WCE21_05275 [Candidatus Babeliales bacterium]
MKRILFTFTCMVVVFNLNGLTSQEREYLKKYAPPAPIKAELDAMTNKGQNDFSTIGKPAITVDGWKTTGVIELLRNSAFGKIQSFFAKIGYTHLARLDNAYDMKKVIVDKNLNLCFVPNKYAYENKNKLWVIAEGVSNFAANKELNVSQVTQLCQLAKINFNKGKGLAEKKYFADFKDDNIKPLDNGQVAIIDTGNEGFSNDKRDKVQSLKLLFACCTLNSEAQSYVKTEVKYAKARNEISAWFQEEYQKEKRQKGIA